MGHRNQARQALESSVLLLKTAPAMHRLSRYTLGDGNTNVARQYLSEAAVSNTQAQLNNSNVTVVSARLAQCR